MSNEQENTPVAQVAETRAFQEELAKVQGTQADLRPWSEKPENFHCKPDSEQAKPTVFDVTGSGEIASPLKQYASPPPTATDTPETDRMVFLGSPYYSTGEINMEWIDFARTLERQRDAANKRAKHYFTAYGTLDAMKGELETLTSERDQLRRERDEALRHAEKSLDALNKRDNEVFALHATLADTQRELAQLRHEKEQADSPMFSRRELLAKLDDAKKDGERLDWLEKTKELVGTGEETGALFWRQEFAESLRSAIDAARAQKPE